MLKLTSSVRNKKYKFKAIECTSCNSISGKRERERKRKVGRGGEKGNW